MTIQQIEHRMMSLSTQDRVYLMRRLLDSFTVAELDSVSDEPSERQNPLLKWAGVFSAGPADVSERAEEILLEAVDPISGFGK